VRVGLWGSMTEVLQAQPAQPAQPMPPGVAPEHAFTMRAPSNAFGMRIVWAILFFLPLAVVVTSAFLTPSAAGLGTHTQLGLAPCGFYEWTGLPCPGCGLTTCFAHMVRGEVIGASRANAFGVLLFLTTLVSLPFSLLGLWRGLSVSAVLERLSVDKMALILACGSIGVWLVRLLTIYFVY
jgi:hypothetical protein